MKANLKKSIALASALAVVAVSTLSVYATNTAINGATASYSTTTVTVTNTAAFTNGSNEITFATIKNLDGTATTGGLTLTPSGAGTNDTSVLTISADPSTTDDNKVLVISFVTATGDFGTAQLTVGTPANNTVSVTANVVPTLSLTLSGTTVALGALDSSTVVTAATHPTATVRTNAIGGFNLLVASSNNGLHSTSANYTISGATANSSEGYALAGTE